LQVNSSSLLSVFRAGGGPTGFDCEITRFDKAASSGGSRRLFRSDSPGDVDAEPGRCRGLSITESTAYTIVLPLLDDGVSELWSIPIVLGDATRLWRPESGEALLDVAVAGERVVFASSIRLGSVPTSAGASSSTISSGAAYRVITDAELAYYVASLDGSDGCAGGSLFYAVALAGGAPFLLARDPRPGCVEDFVADSDSLYWLTDVEAPDTIRQVRKAAKH
jgi:hypothetical protein